MSYKVNVQLGEVSASASISGDAIFQVITLTFPVAAVMTQEFVINNHPYATTYSDVRTRGDIQSYSFEKNGSAVTLPFDLQDGDVLQVSITKQDFLDNGSLSITT